MNTSEYLDMLAGELAILVIQANAWADENGWPNVERYPQYRQTRSIGQEVHDLAGLKGMQAVFAAVSRRVAASGNDDISLVLLEYGWSDIGSWQA